MSRSGRRAPVATYRVQLTPRFGFAAAARLVPYLRALGISDLYLSPVMEARRGSDHGYDVVDPTRLSAERGGDRGFAALTAALRKAGMGLVVDLVPHHLAAHESNPWWWDLLRRGSGSPHRRTFEVDDPDAVVVPILGPPYAEVLAAGELRIERRGAEHVLRYADRVLPLDPEAWRPTLGRRAPTAADIRNLNRDAALLDAVVRAQHYRLVHWRVANEQVNYRRFFDIADLAGVRAEAPAVFAATHRRALRLANGRVPVGFRVDHIDGLRDPEAYLRRLRRAAPDAYIVVEKIVAPGETIPASWPVEGTTGYEILGTIGGLAVEPRGFESLKAAYARFTGTVRDGEAAVAEAKRAALRTLFATDVERVLAALLPPARSDPEGRDCSHEHLRAALIEITVHLPVYRTYARDGALSTPDRRLLDGAGRRASSGVAPGHARAVRIVRRVLLGEVPEPDPRVVELWQQLSGPAMAKGFEDTALYRYLPLSSANEVGGEPEHAAVSVEAFHRAMRDRLRVQPRGMSATSTHDTKRGEDTRARIASISEIPGEFARAVRRWHRLATRYRTGDAPAPDEEWLLYQTILGTWDGGGAVHVRRVQDYMVKAAREAKLRTGWLDPNAAHEKALRRFVAGVLADKTIAPELGRIAERLARAGAISSLAQAVLRTTVPGVPDLYQGSEAWNLSLVDPDNRRPVPYGALRRDLARMDAAEGHDRAGLLRDLLRTWRDGRVKQYATSRALRFRAADPDLFDRGSYVPVRVRGRQSSHVVSFMRSFEGRHALVVVPRLTMSLVPRTPGGSPRIPAKAWGSAALDLPARAPAQWEDAFTGATISGRKPKIAALLEGFPVALLRSAG